MTSKPPTTNRTPDDPGMLHEKPDVSLRGIVAFGGALVAGGVVIGLLIWALFQYFGSVNAGQVRREYPLAPTGVLRLPPAPRLQDKPREDLKALRRQEERMLTEYGWADENAGLARIPVDEAMRRVLARGLPAAPASPDGGRPPIQPSKSNSGRTLQEGQAR